MIIAGTGHRPDKLGGYGQKNADHLKEIAKKSLIELKPTIVISGMALGWDTALALAAIELKIPLHAYIPFYGQEIKWYKQDVAIYYSILKQCAKVKFCCDPGYAVWKMQKRNEMMVDSCNMVLAMFDGTPGGTYNCLKYAEAKKKTIINLYDQF